MSSKYGPATEFPHAISDEAWKGISPEVRAQMVRGSLGEIASMAAGFPTVPVSEFTHQTPMSQTPGERL